MGEVKLPSDDGKRRKLYVLKSQISALNTNLTDKQRQTQKIKNESDFTLNRIEQIEIEIYDYNVIDKNKDFLYLNAEPFVWESKKWVYVNEWDSVEYCPYWECESKIIKKYTNKEGKHCVEFQDSFNEFPEACLRWE